MISQFSGLRKMLKQALAEDRVRNDITTRLLFPKTVKAEAVIQVKQEAVMAGLPVAVAACSYSISELRTSLSLNLYPV